MAVLSSGTIRWGLWVTYHSRLRPHLSPCWSSFQTAISAHGLSSSLHGPPETWSGVSESPYTSAWTKGSINYQTFYFIGAWRLVRKKKGGNSNMDLDHPFNEGPQADRGTRKFLQSFVFSTLKKCKYWIIQILLCLLRSVIRRLPSATSDSISSPGLTVERGECALNKVTLYYVITFFKM